MQFSYISHRIWTYIVIGVAAIILVKLGIRNSRKAWFARKQAKLQQIARRHKIWDQDFHQMILDYKQAWNDHDNAVLQDMSSSDHQQQILVAGQLLQDMHRQFSESEIAITFMKPYKVQVSSPKKPDNMLGLQVIYNSTVSLQESGSAQTSYHHEAIEMWEFIYQDGRWLITSIRPGHAYSSNEVEYTRRLAKREQLIPICIPSEVLLPKQGWARRKSLRFGGLVNQDIEENLDPEFTTSGEDMEVFGHYVAKRQDALIQVRDTGGRGILSRSNHSIIFQITLPKSYEYIVIRPKKYRFLKRRLRYAPKNLTFEWNSFNKHFEVATTNKETLASFELLHPDFMAYMLDHAPEVFIEVIDNTVSFSAIYFSDKSVKATDALYSAILDLAERAHKALRK